jgi:membrane protein YdbS with pleckstrin-like domain
VTERLETAATTATEWKRVSPRYVVVDVAGYIVSGLITIALTFVPFFITQAQWTLAVPAVAFVVSLITVLYTPRRVRSIGYALRDDDLLFRRGIAWQRFVSIPYGRMQLVDIKRGPLARSLGLSELRFVTAAASSTVVIPGITAQEAEDLRDHLVDLAETRRAGL